MANALTLRVQPLKLLTIEPTGEAAPGQRIILTGRVIDEKETAVSSGLPMVLCLTGPTRGPVKM